MTCNRCTRAPVGACVGQDFCESFDLTDDDACNLAAETCLSWWLKRDEVSELDDALWKMSEERINELANDPLTARAYLAERRMD
jgi:hypothetical protein